MPVQVKPTVDKTLSAKQGIMVPFVDAEMDFMEIPLLAAEVGLVFGLLHFDAYLFLILFFFNFFSSFFPEIIPCDTDINCPAGELCQKGVCNGNLILFIGKSPFLTYKHWKLVDISFLYYQMKIITL